ncbi:MAG: nuclear transport factor 2 family protein [Verrucomicrobiales bacterium]|nr:nuclear transport factor 2 family protein [Verrucomicrobiales bacterium]
MRAPFFIPIFALCLSFPHFSRGEEPIGKLQKTAENFVRAYNAKDLDGIRSLFADDAELINDSEQLRFQGIGEILSVFSESFSDFPQKQVSLEVTRVRLLTADVAVEDGVLYFSDAEDSEFFDTVPYSATLVRGENGNWEIALSHEFQSMEPEVDLSILDRLSWLEGEWTLRSGPMRMDVQITRREGGVFYTGKAISTLSTGEELKTDLRIGFDPTKEAIRWWTFDEMGGYSSGLWISKDEEGNAWTIQSRGVTSSGETNSATQAISFDGENTLLWESSNRQMDDESLPNIELRLVRMPPKPQLPVGAQN